MINLLPSDIKKARVYGRRNIKMLSYSIAIFFVGIVSVTVLLLNMTIIAADKTRLNAEMTSRQPELDKLQNEQKRIDTIATQLKVVDKLYTSEVRFSQAIPKIGALLPNGMVLNGLSLTGGKTSPLQLDVDMESQQLAAIFQQNLVSSDVFEAADISAITSKGGATKPGVKSYSYGATLSASFKGSAAAKKAAAAPAPVAPKVEATK
jgi:Tfp pilus assembly protein PilN